MFECHTRGGRFNKKYETHAPKAVWIGQPTFVPCPGKLVEVSGDVLIDGLPEGLCDLDYGLPSRDMEIGRFRTR